MHTTAHVYETQTAIPSPKKKKKYLSLRPMASYFLFLLFLFFACLRPFKLTGATRSPPARPEKVVGCLFFAPFPTALTLARQIESNRARPSEEDTPCAFPFAHIFPRLAEPRKRPSSCDEHPDWLTRQGGSTNDGDTSGSRDVTGWCDGAHGCALWPKQSKPPSQAHPFLPPAPTLGFHVPRSSRLFWSRIFILPIRASM